jgi:hypothetical protein
MRYLKKMFSEYLENIMAALYLHSLSTTSSAKMVNGPVVQLVRMPPCHGGGRGFESRPVRSENEKH